MNGTGKDLDLEKNKERVFQKIFPKTQ